MRLFGREAERAALDALLSAARSGRSAGLVLRGEAGVGKTALLRYAESRATNALWISGVEPESDFPYAALHRLLIPLLDFRSRLPEAQRAALEVACGLADGPPPDLYLVSLAALTLLAGPRRRPADSGSRPGPREGGSRHDPGDFGGRERPDGMAAAGMRLCVVDDAQWLDQESLRALAFVARRLHAEGVVLLFGLRVEGDPGGDPGLLAGVPAREIGGLAPDAAVALLTHVVDTTVDRARAEHIARATGGNPLALTDLAQELTADQLGGSVALPEPAPIGSRLEAHYAARIAGYPAATRTWLLLAAANAGGPGDRLTEAARSLGVAPGDAAPAEADRMLTGSPPSAFRHPLMRSAVYGGAAPADRRAAHRALSAITTAEADADHRAWHLAAAADGPDETTAAELERRADRAGARGGHTARATFLTRAAELTPDPGQRAARQVRAAEASLAAGAYARALLLLDGVDESTLPGPVRGSALMTRSLAEVNTGTPDGQRLGAARCLAAAQAFGDDRARARRAVVQAIELARSAEHLSAVSEPEIAAEAARLTAGDRPPAEPETRAAKGEPGGLDGLILAGYAAFTVDGYDGGLSAVRRALDAILDPGLSDDALLARMVVGVNFATLLWDDAGKIGLLRRAETAARRTGALHSLDLVHYLGAMTWSLLGELNEADRHDAAGLRLRAALGMTDEQAQVWRHPELATWRTEPGLRESVGAALGVFEMLNLGGLHAWTRLSLGVLDNAEGQYASARDTLSGLVELGRPHRYAYALPDLVEAALRSGDRRTAKLAAADLAVVANACGTPRVLGVLERSRALLTTSDEAEDHYRQAIGHLTGEVSHGDTARAHLLYGEWLRRQRRRRDAREQLGTALEMFESVRAEVFAERTRKELRALGGTVLHPVRERNETALTPQEAAVARLARDGGTNAEIAANLFLSPNTVDYHLRKVYRKLGVRSRRQLRDGLHD
ncbi:AAA family ATPase [Actinoplanes bogorensis]|uniref:AAA family ATPase n=1 Tax=Paractinoplanes bogorensis TaxID=1610840 RepID=A0ABS5YF67_9ACTN|nr:LuxR family transcriptional regulator [Actinoplanes bogorensis]MBU2662094.1 AAA family ATPase [Actinoplanes bogorensis]